MALPVVTIDENGIHRPDYEDVRAYFVSGFQGIFGNDIYVNPDSQDGQQIAVFSQAVHDCNGMAQATYSAYSPSTARGVGLSSNVKINGLERNLPSYSTVDLLIVGQVGTTIYGGIANDSDGNQWSLPAIVTIPVSGEITVTATAREQGAIEAGVGTINEITTPTKGWQSVNNLSAATAGEPVELDAELRKRQTISTMLPSKTIFEATMGAIAGISGVVRSRGYENDTGAPDTNGIPARTIALVVDGGNATEIAQVIADNKSLGTSTYGTTSVDIVDEYGVTRAINFFRPTLATIGVNIVLTPLSGYTAEIENNIKQETANWITGLEIGTSVEWGEVFMPVNLYGTYGGTGYKTYKIVSIQLNKNGGAFAAADVTVLFNEAANADVSNINIAIGP